MAYNDTYHVGIGCTPNEPYCDISGNARLENSINGKYRKMFKERKKEKFYLGQAVRYSKKENLKSFVYAVLAWLGLVGLSVMGIN
ncbi:hypothetical protein GVAV_001154 [Gurleya vavrai]